MMTASPARAARPRVVVIGGGFGGLAVVRALRDTVVDVTLIDQHAYNQFQPLLYQVATATLNPGDITWFLRAIRSNQKNVRFLKGKVLRMNHVAKTISLDGGQQLAYDYLVIAAGVTTNYFGVTGAEEHAMPLYQRLQALELRDAMFAQLEQAAINGKDQELRIVIVGGGATGVETAGAFAELRNNDMSVTYPELDPKRIHVTLVERMPSLLGPFHESLQEYARKALEKRGVDLRLNTAVREVRADGVVIGDEEEFLPAGIVVWASGVTAHDTVKNWAVPQGRGGRISVNDHLRVEGLNCVFAIGDAAVEEGDRALPQLAQPALQGGRFVGELIDAEIKGTTRPAFRYRDKGSLATIGRSSAVAEVSGLPRLTGFPAWVIWVTIHVFSLLGNRNRLATMINLGAKYLFWRHSQNAIVGETPAIIEQPRKKFDATS
ncbi:NADH dehydrogenase [Actinotalea ferrariae CF5-4]|uniref:NADH:ubiquinone reductase (non-electrogenic) n=2 Tax=Actinotalea TaxID=458839 RepID=A0A021VYZ7_9CELL|nr:NADH dehydrogenase [Actinotalea ferrariae CF5-4]